MRDGVDRGGARPIGRLLKLGGGGFSDPAARSGHGIRLVIATSGAEREGATAQRDKIAAGAGHDAECAAAAGGTVDELETKTPAGPATIPGTSTGRTPTPGTGLRATTSGARRKAHMRKAPKPLTMVSGRTASHPMKGKIKVRPRTMLPRKTRRHGSTSSRDDRRPVPMRRASPAEPNMPSRTGVKAMIKPTSLPGPFGATLLIMIPSAATGTATAAPKSPAFTGEEPKRSAAFSTNFGNKPAAMSQ